MYTIRDLENDWVGTRIGTLPYEEAKTYIGQDEHLLVVVHLGTHKALLCVDKQAQFQRVLDEKGAPYRFYAVTDREYQRFRS